MRNHKRSNAENPEKSKQHDKFNTAAMRKYLLSFILVAVAVAAFAQKKVAVYVTGDDPINEIVASRLVDGLARNGKYTAVERTASFLSALSKEHDYELNGAVDDDEIAKIGRQFSVQYVCVASALDVWGNEKYITAHIIDVETAEVVASCSSNGALTTSRALIDALDKLSDNFLRALDYYKNATAKKVAVYVTKTGNRDIDIILGDQLVAGFAQSGKYVAIERTNSFLSQISKEQGYQQSGAVDDDDLTRLGKQFGVQYVCVAKTTSWAGDYFISTRLIDVSSAEVVNTYNAEGRSLYNSESVLSVAQEIAQKLSGRTIKEEEEYKKAEALRLEQERLKKIEEERQRQQREKEAAEAAEKARVQALVNTPWRQLLNKVTTNVTKRYTSSCYIGEFRDGSKYGTSLSYWDDGDLYCGHYEDGERSGYGMYIVPDGKEFACCTDGWVYVGQWDEGEKSGTGAMYNSDGKLIYYGKFKKDKPKDTYPAPEAYIEAMSEFTFGIINYTNGDKYIGELRNGLKSGKGLYIWEKGDAWYGSWSNDTRNGYGIYMPYSGGYNKGNWENGQKK